MEIVKGWNGDFFKQRGLGVVLNGQDDAVPTTDSSADGLRFSFSPKKFGV